MDIRCACAERVFNDSRCELNDRSVVDSVCGFIIDAVEVIIGELACNAVEDSTRVLHRIAFADSLCDSFLCCEDRNDVHSR